MLCVAVIDQCEVGPISHSPVTTVLGEQRYLEGTLFTEYCPRVDTIFTSQYCPS